MSEDDLNQFTRGVVAEIKDGDTNNRASVSASGALSVSPSASPADVTTLSNVSASASSVTLKAANNRRGLIVQNDADKALMLKYGGAASATSFTVKIAAGGYWEMPQPIYTGVVDGIWETGPTGAARVTELI